MKLYIALPEFDPESKRRLEAHFDVTMRETSDRANEEELLKLSREYDALIIGVAEKITPQMVFPETSVRLIGSTSVGLDHISPEVHASPHVTVINTPASNVLSTAEHVFALALTHQRRLTFSLKAGAEGAGRAGVGGPTRDLAGRTMGIIGAGSIGSATARLALAFGMRVLVHTRRPMAHSELAGVTFVDMEELLRESDVVSIHLPLNADTEGSIGQSFFHSLRDDALLISTCRFGLFNSDDIATAFAVGSIPFLALDCVVPQDFRERFAGDDRLLITPHMGGVTEDAVSRMSAELADRFLSLES